MENLENDVTQDSSPEEEVQQPVTQPEESGDQVQQAEPLPEQGQALSIDDDVDESGVSWKNRAMEAQRKLAETAESLPKIIEETLTKSQQKVEQEKYKIDDLEVFLDTEEGQDPANRRWAKGKIRELEDAKRKQELEELLTSREQAQQVAQQKAQVEQEVLNDARFQDAFITDKSGRKIFNTASPLTQLASNYMKDPVLQQRPDGLSVAMKLAYADYSNVKLGKSQQEAEQIKRKNAKLQQAAMVGGGSAQHTPQKQGEYKQAVNELAKTGSKKALRSATQAYLKHQGLIK